jgi:hypothetical protein
MDLVGMPICDSSHFVVFVLLVPSIETRTFFPVCRGREGVQRLTHWEIVTHFHYMCDGGPVFLIVRGTLN